MTERYAGVSQGEDSLKPDKCGVGNDAGSILVLCSGVCSCDDSFMVRQKVG